MKLQDFIEGPDGVKRLASLERAVTKMKSLDSSPQDSADYRRSWTYWANIHGYYGPDSAEGTVQGQRDQLKSAHFSEVELAEALAFYNNMLDQKIPPASETNPAHDIALAVWDTCQHSNPDKDSTAENIGLNQANFFGWHRMYLYYFERVLRWAGQDPTLTLPYWDYTNPTQEELPAPFRNKASSLYDDRRDFGMNTDRSQLIVAKTDIDQLLSETNYLAYEYHIERGVHGYIHCTIGMTCPVAHMGDVPVAGNDPIFYTHHANIDRMWSCWQKLHPKPNTMQPQLWEMEQFMFPDETGSLQRQPVMNFEDSTKLGYKYDNETSCYRIPPATPNVIDASSKTGSLPLAYPNLVNSSKSIKLQPNTTTIDISIPSAKLGTMSAKHSSAGTGTELVLRELAADVPPASQLDIYIEIKGQPASRQYVGTVNWFGAFGHHGMHMPSNQSYDFPITKQFKALKLSLSSRVLTIKLQASSGREPSGKVEAITPDRPAMLNDRANIRVKSIELRQTR